MCARPVQPERPDPRLAQKRLFRVRDCTKFPHEPRSLNEGLINRTNRVCRGVYRPSSDMTLVKDAISDTVDTKSAGSHMTAKYAHLARERRYADIAIRVRKEDVSVEISLKRDSRSYGEASVTPPTLHATLR